MQVTSLARRFWLNVSDEDAKRYIRIFTNIGKEECEALIAEHDAAPHLRLVQKRLAKDVTCMVHSEADYKAAAEASEILFGNNAGTDDLKSIDESMLLTVFEGVPQFRFSREVLKQDVKASDFLTDICPVFFSKSEARKMMQGGGVSVNKEKTYDHSRVFTEADLVDDRYIVLQRGKKNYYLLIAE